MFAEQFSRRDFLKITSISGVTVAFLNPVKVLSQTDVATSEVPALDWRDSKGGPASESMALQKSREARYLRATFAQKI